MGVTIEEARALVADRALWPCVRSFLWDFAPQIHESWIEEKLGDRTSPRVKRHILDTLGVEPCFHTFPKEDKSRILLLDGAVLESLAKWLGALACADALRRVTDGVAVRGLKASLPGVYPEVFGFTAYFGKDLYELGGEGSDVKLNAGFVVGVGCSLLHATVAHLPEPLRMRLRLKLPNSQAAKLPNCQITKLPNIQLLLKLRFPEAYSLCC